jgi:hypothetical protein
MSARIAYRSLSLEDIFINRDHALIWNMHLSLLSEKAAS